MLLDHGAAVALDLLNADGESPLDVVNKQLRLLEEYHLRRCNESHCVYVTYWTKKILKFQQTLISYGAQHSQQYLDVYARACRLVVDRSP